MSAVTDWKAILIDGQGVDRATLLKQQVPWPMHKVRRLAVTTDSPNIPLIRAEVIPELGETIQPFTRYGQKQDGTQVFSVAGVAITPDPNRPDFKIWLFLTPQGPVISTRDLSPKELGI